MGMIRCPVHDLTFIQPCCEHIGDAVAENRPEHANVLVDTFGAPIVLCDACWPNAIQQTANAAEWITIELEIGVEIYPYCSDHLKEWYTATGQGDLSETIAQVKAGTASR